MRAHSEKPEEFYDFVEKLCPAPRYASLFHRGISRPNWDGHGDEYADEVASAPALETGAIRVSPDLIPDALTFRKSDDDIPPFLDRRTPALANVSVR
jgi:hypothetical protein